MIEVFAILGITVNCALLVTFGVVEQLFPSLDRNSVILLVVFIEVSSEKKFLVKTGLI